jgi:hypothetical protein
MSAKKFIQLLEENGVLDASTLRDVRRQISDKQVSAATIAKWLVEKGKLTKFQATKLVGQATATPEPNDDDESSLLLVEDKPAEEEIILLEDAVADAPEDVVGLTPVLRSRRSVAISRAEVAVWSCWTAGWSRWVGAG